MRKIFKTGIFITLSLLLLVNPFFVCAQNSGIFMQSPAAVQIFTEADSSAKQLIFDPPPEVVNGTLMVPVRALAEEIGVSVSWNAKTWKASLNGEYSLVLRVGDRKPAFHPFSKSILLDVAPYIKNNSLYVPLRFIAEFYNKNVTYDKNSRSVNIADSISDGWYLDAPSDYKIKVFDNYVFEGRVGVTIHDHYTNQAMFAIGDELIAEGPYSSVISTAKLPENVNSLIGKISSDRKHSPNVEKLSDKEYMVSYNYNENDIVDEITETEYYPYNFIQYTRDLQRTVIYYLKSVDNDETVFAKIDCTTDYYTQNGSDIIKNLETLQKWTT